METLQLKLGHAELIYVLWAMRTLSLPGIGSKPFGDASGEQILASLAAAEQSLRSRGLIATQEDQLLLDQKLITLLGVCALSDYSVVITSQAQEGQAAADYYHYRHPIWVHHTSGEGVHQFQIIGDTPHLLAVLMERLALDDSNSNVSQEQWVSRTAFDQAIQYADAAEIDRCQAALLDGGLPAEQAQAFQETVAALQSKTFLGVSYDNRTTHMKTDTLILMRSDHQLWCLESATESPKVKLKQVLPTEVENWLVSHLGGVGKAV